MFLCVSVLFLGFFGFHFWSMLSFNFHLKCVSFLQASYWLKCRSVMEMIVRVLRWCEPPATRQSSSLIFLIPGKTHRQCGVMCSLNKGRLCSTCAPCSFHFPLFFPTRCSLTCLLTSCLSVNYNAMSRARMRSQGCCLYHFFMSVCE